MILDTRNLLNLRTIKEAKIYEKSGKLVTCNLCERRCKIPPGQVGFCKTRVNIDGRLYSVVYGDLSAIESRPIEIKPFYHYYPGTTALTISTWSCNFSCPWCQNYELSKVKPNPEKAVYTDPSTVVEKALKNGDKGVCVSFNEPTMLFEYSLDLFELACRRNLYCCWVSNGYMSLEALEMLANSGLSGLKIDVKGLSETYARYIGGADWRIPWRNAEKAKEMGIHVEIVYLMIPTVNDDPYTIKKVVKLHAEHLGLDTPLHINRYFPAYRFDKPPTPLEKLEMMYNFAKKAGLRYVYIGNIPDNSYSNTYCPNCGYLLIKRVYFNIYSYLKDGNACPNCGYRIPIVS